MIISFRLPFPPSVNSLYDGGKNTARRFKSARYKRWINDARPFIQAWKADNDSFTTIREHIGIWYRHGTFGDKRVRDSENYSKALSDMLVDEHIMEDDSLIKRVIADWADDIEEGYTEVVITPLARMAVNIL